MLNYYSGMFWLDLLSMMPWDIIIMQGLGVQTQVVPYEGTLAGWIAILKW